jgi:hypothetical protein
VNGRPGFSLVEAVLVTVFTAVAFGALYETFVLQRETGEVVGALSRDQEALRTAVGILEAELREVGTIGGEMVGGSDIAVATTDSVTFRAQRKVAFVCRVSAEEGHVLAWTAGTPLTAGDRLLLFVDGDGVAHQDDAWDTARVASAERTEDPDCAERWPGTRLQKVAVDGHDLRGVREGAPIRTYEWATYGLYRYGGGWGLGRRSGSSEPDLLVGGLAAPGTGLRLEYFTPSGSRTNDPEQIAWLRIALEAAADPAGPGSATRLESSLYLRNN